MIFLVEKCFTFTPFLMIFDSALSSRMPSQAHSCIVGTGLAPVLIPESDRRVRPYYTRCIGLPGPCIVGTGLAPVLIPESDVAVVDIERRPYYTRCIGLPGPCIVGTGQPRPGDDEGSPCPHPLAPVLARYPAQPDVNAYRNIPLRVPSLPGLSYFPHSLAESPGIIRKVLNQFSFPATRPVARVPLFLDLLQNAKD
jgi:hypothetical protein